MRGLVSCRAKHHNGVLYRRAQLGVGGYHMRWGSGDASNVLWRTSARDIYPKVNRMEAYSVFLQHMARTIVECALLVTVAL